MVDPNTRQGKRAPVTLKIKFKSATLEQFIERYAVDVSHGGIFIRTKEPLAVGTQMRFEFQLRDATPLITGEGTVVWTRENDPARPGVAPGMGVRFDRLNEGSQQVLDKILAEKAKGAGAHAPSDTKPPIFNEAPTKVAPSPLVGALKDETKSPKIGQMAPPRAGFGDERTDATPLPKPMPFHSDADEFPEEAFEEATKVRSLDDLVAATKDADLAAAVPTKKPATTPPPVAAKPAPSDEDKATNKIAPIAPAAPAVPVKDELAERRAAKQAEPAAEPELPKPAAAAPSPAPAAKAEPKPEPKAEEPKRKSEPKIEKAKSEPRADRTPTPSRPKIEAPKPKAAAPVAAKPVEEPAPRGAPIGLLLVLLIVIGGGAAFWFFYLRDRGEPAAGGGSGSAVASGSDTASGSASDTGSGAASASGSSGSGAASASGSDVASGSGAASASGSAVASGSGTGAPAAEMLEVAITSSTKDATVDIADAGVTGAALPYKGKLEKGKTLKAHVSAPGHVAQDVEVAAGKTVDVKLKAMPHVVHVTSKPGGAMIFVDGQPTRRTTPGDVELTTAQADKGAKIELRKAGYDRYVGSIGSDAFSEDSDKLVASLDATLVAAKVVPVNNGGGAQIKHPGGSGAGSASGSAEGSAGSAAGSAGGGAGSTAGSAAGSAGGGSAGAGASAGSAAGSAGGGGAGSSAGSAAGSAGGGAGSAKAGSGATGGGAGSAKAGSGAGSSSGGGGGGGGGGAGSSSGSGSGAGSGSGSSEPTPDWMK